MSTTPTLVDPYAQSATPAPLVDPYVPRGISPSLTPQEGQQATDALVYSHLTGAPPSFTYENRDAFHEDLMTRLGGYAEAGWKGLTKDSIIGEYMRGQVSGPFDSDDEVSKFIEGFGQMIGDLPAYLVGGGLGALAGGVAGTPELPVIGTISGAVIGAGAGGFGLTAGLRQWLMDKYAGKNISAWDEVMDVVKQSAKGALTGAAFGAAGEAAPLAEGMVGKYLGARAYKTAAELAAMTTVGGLLEGKVPSARDFAQNAALLALMHVTIGNLPFAKKSAPDLQTKAMDLYAREGLHPADLSSEAAQRAVDRAPSDNPMEILNRIDNEIAGIPGKTPDAVAESTTKGDVPEQPKGEAAPPSEGETSIKNEVTTAEREARGLPGVEVEARQVPAFRAGKAAVDSPATDPSHIDPRELAKKLADNPRPHTDVEAAALLYDRMRLQNEHAAAMTAIEEARATGNEAAEVVAKDRLSKIEDALNNNDVAARLSGTETGRALNARRMMIKQDYSLANVLQRARAASPDGVVTPEVRNKLEALTSQLDEANKRIDEHTETKKQQAAERVVEKIKADTERATRAGKRVAVKADLDTEYASLIKNLNSELSHLYANPMLNPKLYELFGKLAVNRIQAGYLTIEQIVDDLHGQLQERGISKREIRDYISQYGKKIELSKDEVQVQLREARRQGRLLSQLEDAQAKEQPLRSGLQRDKQTERVKELTKQVQQAMRDAGLSLDKGETSNDQRLATYKKTLETRIRTLQKQLDTGDYTKPTRKQTILDRQAEDLKAQAEKLKSQVDDAIHKQKLAARTPLEKGAAIFQKWRRGILISSVSVAGKIGNMAAQRFGVTPIEELLGGGLSKLPGLSEIADKAKFEGKFNPSAEAKALAAMFSSQTAKDAWDVLKTGKSNKDLLYGKKNSLPPELLDFVGHVHGALQTPTLMADFARRLEKGAQWEIDHGADIADPKVQASLAGEAFIYAQRSVFRQENMVSDAFRMTVRYFETKGLSGKSVAFMLNTVLPIVKLPVNIVGEALEYQFGSVVGSIKALRYILDKDALKGLTGNEADNIMRALKKGNIGLATMAMGYYAGQQGGFIESSGFHQQGDKKKDVFRMGGVDIPTWVLDTPLGLTFQVGATINRVNKTYTVKGKSGGLVAGAIAGEIGVVKKVPFTQQAVQLAGALQSPDTAGLFLDDLIESLIIPPDVRKIAAAQDPQNKQRKPENLEQTIEKNAPGLQENVPTKIKRRKLSVHGGYR